ncbi:Peptidyl-prolyl isomerase cwc27 [Cyphellophora attinorum]|uniref:Peptidyl-prolyl isomerase cwc27 n=1 Tax=Cyphellophora attinorum TaxID=1664694 RepID=A0A0N1GZT8_9EURO|nr:Peptidyl-prolyl isomerase cwc27 [Phialophora attinorum]KPI36713.1 Peptidyl-prolyl isomerase cwc27 [Phialophora attinorum]
MSTHYNTEPPPTASVLLHTTAGAIPISLFAAQTPLTTRNFLQHCLDGTYDNTIFHRNAPGFVLQTGDPTGTGEGGENIYEDKEFERYDEHWARLMGREAGEKIVFGDEVHSRLKFNRRGLVGMAKSEGGTGSGYGSQWFITLGDARVQLEGRCTMFGRVEGEGIYNVKVLRIEVTMWPKGEAWEGMRRRVKVVKSIEQVPKKPAAKKAKKPKAVLSFGDDEDGGDVPVKPKKAKFNTALIDASTVKDDVKVNGTVKPNPQVRPPSPPPQTIPAKRKASDASSRSPQHHRKPSSPESSMQLPLRNPEQPSRSPSEPSSRSSSPTHRRQSASKSRAALEDEINALKASMKRSNHSTIGDISRKQSALEALIPATSTRGRKRPRPGDTGSGKDEAKALKMLNAFRARLEGADGGGTTKTTTKSVASATNGSSSKAKLNGADPPSASPPASENEGDEEARLCDLHFIANCQSCFAAEQAEREGDTDADILSKDDDDRSFLSHSLNFAKDMLGKDTEWRKGIRNREVEDDGGLVVIDPRAKEREILGKKAKGRGKEREWDQR